MNIYADADHLLTSALARRLYEAVYEFSNNIFLSGNIAGDVLKNKHFSNISEFWLDDSSGELCDLMRLCGVEKKYLGSDVSDYDRFRELCTIFPMLAGHSAYESCHRELATLFDCDLFINQKNCPYIWDIVSNRGQGFYIADLLDKIGIKKVCVSCGLDEKDKEYRCDTRYPLALSLQLGTFFDLPLEPKILNLRCGENILTPINDKISEFFDGSANLKCKIADVTLPADFVYIKPAFYTANKVALTDDPTIEDKNLWRCQMLRDIGKECIKSGMVIRLSAKPSRELTKLFEYLADSDTLAKILFCPYDCKAGELSDFVLNLRGNVACNVFICPEKDIAEYASYLPLGMMIDLPVVHGRSSFTEPDCRLRRVCSYLADLYESGRYGDCEGELFALIKKIYCDNVNMIFGGQE